MRKSFNDLGEYFHESLIRDGDKSLLMFDRSRFSPTTLDRLTNEFYINSFLVTKRSSTYVRKVSDDGDENGGKKIVERVGTNSLEDLQNFIGSARYMELIAQIKPRLKHTNEDFRRYWKQELAWPLALVSSKKQNTADTRIGPLDIEFKEELELLLDRTHEMDHVANDIYHEMNVKLGLQHNDRRCFLEIGPGTGHLAMKLSPFYTRISFVEPNCLLFIDLIRKCMQTQKENSRLSANFVGYNLAWDTDPKSRLEEKLDGIFVPPKFGFDFVVMSHVLYYLPKGDSDVEKKNYKGWVDFIVKGFEYTKVAPTGRVIVVLQSNSGQKGEFFNACRDPNHFKPNDVNPATLAEKLEAYVSPRGERYSVVSRNHISPPGTFTVKQFARVAPLLALRSNLELDEGGKAGFSGFLYERFGIQKGGKPVPYEQLLQEFGDTEIEFNNGQSVLYIARKVTPITEFVTRGLAQKLNF